MVYSVHGWTPANNSERKGHLSAAPGKAEKEGEEGGRLKENRTYKQNLGFDVVHPDGHRVGDAGSWAGAGVTRMLTITGLVFGFCKCVSTVFDCW
jgi:hypothetical protein